ncbi:MAG: M23 family metallopeptidase [Bacteroidota bacterium]
MVRLIVIVLLVGGVTFWSSLPLTPLLSSSPPPPFPLSPIPPSSLPPTPLLSVFDSLTTDFHDYAWPTEAGRIVTSTFGEYRRTHFHGGIDISSGDITGYGVRAARDGYVARMRIGATGYGKMLYVRHPDGFTTTYAHLQRFAPAIDARAEAEQRRRECYPLDLTFTADEFPVLKGDLIAYSGETGTGSPHLHFEIRDRRMNPLNPFLAPSLRIRDDIPPTIRKIAVSPLAPGAMVDGRSAPQVYAARSAGPHRYRVARPIIVTGAAGFSVDARDRIDGSRFRNGVYAHTLLVDDADVYTVRLDRTPAGESHEIGLYYEGDLLRERRGRFEKLYMTGPNDLPFYAPRSWMAGVISDAAFTQGPHRFRIVSRDFNGNEAEMSGTIIVTSPPWFTVERSGNNLNLRFAGSPDISRIFVAARSPLGFWSNRIWPTEHDGPRGTSTIPIPEGGWDVLKVFVEDRWGVPSPPRFITGTLTEKRPSEFTVTCASDDHGVRVRLHATGVFTAMPLVTVAEGAETFTVVVRQEDAGAYEGRFRPSERIQGTRRVTAEAAVNGVPATGEASIALFPVVPGSSGALSLDGGNLVIRYDTLSVLTPLFLRWEAIASDDVHGYALKPVETILRDGLTVTVRDSSDDPHRALFFRSRGGWELIGGEGADRTSGHIDRSLGEVALLRDDTPPSIYGLSISTRGTRRPVIRFRFQDDRSGIEYDRLKVYIDGAVVIPEIDGEHRRAVCQVTEPLERGPHQLTVRLHDRLGNATTVERRFFLR